jgi:hypothetical protein
MPRLVAKESNDGSGPVEAIPRSYPVRPSLQATPGLHSEPVLRPSSPPHDCIENLKVDSLILVDLTNISSVLNAICILNAGHENSFTILLFVIKDALNFSGGLHGLIPFCVPVLQHVIADLLLETAQDHGIEHKELHSSNSLE